MSNIKIFVATHKKYDFPQLTMYIPIQVGCALKKEDFGYAKDNNIRDNISHKNTSFCELTALYSVWKDENYNNLDYIGLSHYRRYFSGNEFSFNGKKILNQKEAEKLLQTHDIIVPKKRNYYIETIYDHYKHAHYENDLLKLKTILLDKYPEYINSFDTIMSGKTIHLFNMFVMKKEHFNMYMTWLFDILFTLEKQIDISSYDTYQSRVFGFLSERLLNVWIHQQGLSIAEVKVVNIEGENLLKKGCQYYQL